MQKRDITYTFVHVEKCNMCLNADFKVLGKRLNQHQGKNPRRKAGITTTVMQCRNCGLIFANPLPIPKSIGDHYDVAVDHYFGDHIKNIPANYFQNEMDTFKSIYPVQPGTKGLDIGTGLGGVMTALERNGIEAYGLEPSKSFYDFALTRGFSRDRLVNSSMEDATFQENYFDLVIFSAVFEHLYDPNQAIVNALKWLKPGGIIYIGVPSNRIFVQRLANLFYRLKGLDYVSNISPMHEPFHLYEFGTTTFAKNSVRNGYSIVKRDFWTTEDYLFKKSSSLIKKIIKLTKSDMNLTIWLQKN